MAGGSLGSLTIDLAANITRFEKSLNRAEQLSEKRARAIKRTFTRLATGIGASLASYGFARAIEGALEFADSIGKAADRAGVGTQKLQELRFAADQFGISTQQLDDGLRRFTRRLGVALDGGSFKKDFDELGVAIRDVNGNVRSSEDVFDDVARAMGGLGSAAEKSKVAAQLFGDDAGPQLALLLGQGEGAIDALAREAQRLGIILDEDLVRGAERANDALSKIKQVASISFTRQLASLAPEIEELATALGNLAKGDVSKLPAWLKQVVLSFEVLDFAVGEATGLIGKFGAAIALLFSGEFSALGELFDESAERTEKASQRLDEYLKKLYAVKDAQSDDGGDLPGRGISEAAADDGKNFFTGLTDQEMDDQLTAAMTMEESLNAFYEVKARERAAIEQKYNSAVNAARTDAFNKGVDLLRRFAGENETIARILIILQTAKAVKDIQIQAHAAAAQVMAYGQVEAAAHSALFNYGAAAAAITRATAAAASIETAAAISTALVVGTGVADFAGVGTTGGTGGATAPLGSVGNPITAVGDAPAAIPAATGTTGTITINVNGVVTEEIMQDLIVPAIQDAANERDIILFRSDSRQAAELVA